MFLKYFLGFLILLVKVANSENDLKISIGLLYCKHDNLNNAIDAAEILNKEKIYNAKSKVLIEIKGYFHLFKIQI